MLLQWHNKTIQIGKETNQRIKSYDYPKLQNKSALQNKWESQLKLVIQDKPICKSKKRNEYIEENKR